ncbi:ATP-binding cassette domain-containing protein [Saccharibacillus sp. CPCC 101409]|uniref:ABC transporter ATP-binding protein n=1 Tax=Saccharibacillus sp. CPCC 101409 TaxID=3058041 RepID=UPI0026714BB8|nr:ATP-binding cassette domain-containing protein [Saccharibacillus sp. CPCC 101409]MDO3412417.1 ATP-binding cassette domain-containing protein [Saccharibacillus sp. CPCC 101409]
MSGFLLEIAGLNKVYRTRGGADFAAVRDVSFQLGAGETLGIVGESGSGKTTVAKMVAGMLPATSGRIALGGKAFGKSGRSRADKKKIQYIFQDPVSSLNPRLKVRDLIAEPLKLYFKLPPGEIDKRVDALLADVGLPRDYRSRYPKELSGGQCQRVGIARALAAEPSIIVCDEPTSALDMTIQSQILELLKQLQLQKGVSYLFIAHGLEVIYSISHRVLVMKDGEIVEQGDTRSIFHRPRHGYTQSLIGAIPRIPFPAFE